MSVPAWHPRLLPATRRALLRAPIAIVLVLGWAHRWVADDAFVAFRVVRQLEHGNGLVFNVGDRVEAATSPLWVVLLAIVDGVTPFRLEWIAVVLGLAMTAGGVWLAIAGTERLPRTADSRPGALRPATMTLDLPLGMAIFVALLPVWDFATSGLENGLGLFWIGWCWYLIAGIAGRERAAAAPPGSAAPLPWPVLLLVGSGVLIRPDFAIFTLGFGVALIALGERPLRAAVRVALWVLLVPVSGTLLRAAYYGVPVPNTAIAKEAGMSSWQRGWWYLQDLIGSSWLLVPLVLVATCFLAPLVQGRTASTRRRRIPVIAALSTGLLHGFFVVRAGGDFMHGRLLLPSLFAVLLAFAVVSVTDWRFVPATAIVAWALVSGVHARPHYSTTSPADGRARPIDAIDPRTNIADERLFYLRLSGRAHPVTLADYGDSIWGIGGRTLSAAVAAGTTGLLVDTESSGNWRSARLQSPHPGRVSTVVYIGAAGIYSYSAPLDVWVLDRFGLSNSVSAHQRLERRGRPGHEKDLPIAWVEAEYTTAQGSANGTESREVTAARRALQCGDLRDLLDAQRNQLSIGQVLRNISRSWRLWRFRMPSSPVAAASELCA